ncbi:MAG TPA: hypothetical protein VFS43_28110 [Polyangiaceae bacterium]|nr:hypothetical protein [Polyangiaceae bacterium]
MAPLPRRRWPAALLLVALPLQACGGGEQVRVRVPLRQNPEGALVAERCVLDCRIHAGALPSKYAECLAGCPGAEVEGGERCEAEDRAPRAVCVESPRDPNAEVAESDEPKSSGRGAAEAVSAGLSIASLLLDLASIGSKKRKGGAGTSGGRESSGARSSGGHHGAASPSRGHAPASPSRGHAPASPSRGSSSGHSPAKPSVN